ncbi:hypothetical protein DS031_18805 [Bacillus taeanensis]|uniref:Peptidase C39-like domain-containing protein n=2 Tax=Bacillus taeanensis TaxID=273032 RepID=A0A366XNW1_9BACI|nr:hypothetical protein DS031_18805 [Bacillus taeanensis]
MKRKYRKISFAHFLLFFILSSCSILYVKDGDYTKLNVSDLKEKLWNTVIFENTETVFANNTIKAALRETFVNERVIKDSVKLDVRIISQLPELPRGCEVTSLAMLLNHAGVNTDKMILAKEIKKDPTPYKKQNGQVYFGNPYDGFVGDMYNKNNPGLGVYHGPIRKLAIEYLPGQIIDLTGKDFNSLYSHLSAGKPVWIITNTQYRQLPASYFEKWETPSGTLSVTYKEHSVLVTGYDHDYIYFNDPLTGQKNRKAPKEAFIKAWEQMGRQAVTYTSFS